MADLAEVSFVPNPAVRDSPDKYRDVDVGVAAVLKSWKSSLFSFEWMDGDGRIKPADDLKGADRDARSRVEQALHDGEKLEKPVLGIGLLDNIEIGSGRATFLTLADLGYHFIPVHIPLSHEKEFSKVIVAGADRV